jgi:2-polyprenyl-6-hydroxyphenyl methylase/3-demethylubiquinone-9 3-methyltransferase
MAPHAAEVAAGKRFEFGKNWQRFLSLLDEARILQAENSLREMLAIDLAGKRFLDIGCGSGLFSLAARRLGAMVYSFDYDPASVACAEELKRRYFPDDSDWSIEAGSILDSDYVESLGQFDVVYSWGVLHHTGDMWKALDHAQLPVGPGGSLFIAIYNDQGFQSRVWARIKRLYCSGAPGKRLVTALFVPFFFLVLLAYDLVRFRNPARRYIDYKTARGMSMLHDWIDWLGGYPFEVATPGAIVEFFRQRSFRILKQNTTTRLGCNEFVLRRDSGMEGSRVDEELKDP